MIGDMDFKVAGSQVGITAIQLDTKLDGGGWCSVEQYLIMYSSVEQYACIGRLDHNNYHHHSRSNYDQPLWSSSSSSSLYSRIILISVFVNLNFVIIIIIIIIFLLLLIFLIISITSIINFILLAIIIIILGVPLEILFQALSVAREGRLQILDNMSGTHVL